MNAGGDLLAGLTKAFTDRLAATDEFDWSRDASVILGHQPATAVYQNQEGAVVIRQEGVGDGEDQYVTFGTAEAVHVLIAALKREIGAAR